jgi:alkanesulfonate monooxygenase SsuD/methylene tetrahydromethanopterin reductase-like flavin-dependent oxidoreductase (luciferase family)
VRFGVITLQDATWPELVGRWRRLEQLGIETIWVADHLVGPPATPWFEGWSCITALAHLTEAPRIGPLVSPMTYRNPAVLACTALTVAELSGGRLELGVGSGGSRHDHAIAGVPEWTPKERAKLFEGWIDELLAALADDRLQPKQATKVPLTIAGSGPTILRLAARHADRWNTFGGVGLTAEEGLERGRRDNERLDELCAETGRTVLRSALVGYPFVAETPFRSVGTWHDFVGRWEDAGFQELVLYYPWDWRMPEGAVESGLPERMLGKG